MRLRFSFEMKSRAIGARLFVWCRNRKLPTRNPDQAATRKKAAGALDERRKILGKRGWTIILLGFAGAFQSRELIALDVENVRVNDELAALSR